MSTGIYKLIPIVRHKAQGTVSFSCGQNDKLHIAQTNTGIYKMSINHTSQRTRTLSFSYGQNDKFLGFLKR